MKHFGISLVVLLSANPAFAGIYRGVVVSVDEKGFTIQHKAGDKITMIFGPEMGKKDNRYARFSLSNAAPDEIKVGMTVIARFQGKSEDGTIVCRLAEIIIEHIGPREIDFSPLLAKGEKSVSPCTVQINAHTKPKRNERSVIINSGIVYKDGASLKRIKEEIKNMLSKNGWKVKEGDDWKLVIEGAKGDPVLLLKAEAKGLPKDRQPKVRRLDPSK